MSSKVRNIAGYISRKRYFNACQCYDDKYNPKEPRLFIDEASHIISCQYCECIIDPFTAIVIMANYEKRREQEVQRYIEAAKRFWKIAHSYKPYRVALKEIERNMGRGDNAMLPCCPKCDQAFDPADIKAYVNKKWVCD